MHVAIVGAGGMGGYFGALLARAGHDVTFIARGPRVDALNQRGLTLTSTATGHFTVPVRATADPATVTDVDVVLFCVKTYDVDGAAVVLPALVGPGTVIVPVQNGVEAAEQIQAVVGSGPVVGGISWVTAHAETMTDIVHVRGNRLVIGELAGGTSPRVDDVCSTFRQAGIAAEAHPAVRVALWEKFMSMCPVGGLSGLTRLPLGPIFTSPELLAVARQMMVEVEAVGRAQGVDLPPGTADRACAAVVGMASEAPWGFPSLYQDLIAGRRIEIDALSGAVVRQGRVRGVETPLNAVVAAALSPYRGGAPAIPRPPG